MNKEVKEFEKLLKLVNPERLDEYGLMIFKEINILLDYINQLETKINTYENPEDMTLMFMWCNEKSKDKIKELQQRIDKAIEEIKDLLEHWKGNDLVERDLNTLLEILERGKE